MKVFLKKYQIFISALHLSGLLALLGGCSALVAPDVKSGGSLPDLANLEVCNPALGLADDCSNKAASEVEENVPSGVDNGTLLGLIENEEAELGSFAGKSAYGTYSDTGLTIFVSNQEEYDTRFRQVAEYQCKDCSGDDDPNCKESAPSTGTTEYVMISFSKPNAASGDDFLGSPDGWPIADENNNDSTTDDIETNDSFPLQNGLSVYYSGASPASLMGSVNFADGGRPENIEEDFDFNIDVVGTGGEEYKAKISGTVYETPTQPEYPTDCTLENKKYVVPVYE